jgi:disulfide bond formation protein DsbB
MLAARRAATVDRCDAEGYFGRAMVAQAVALMDKNPAAAAALVVAAGGAATILGAFYFQYGLGIVPCPLCLEQRWFYYVAIPLALVVAAAAGYGAPRRLVLGGLTALALVLVGGAALAVFHSGVEWHWWEGPQDCSGPLNPLGTRSLLEQLQTINVVRCDEAPWRFLGLSLAGWNVLISLSLAAVALWGFFAARRQAPFEARRA